MTEKTIGPDVSWRLIHNGTDVLAMMETGGYTTTLHTVFEAFTEAECLVEIDRLGLNIVKDFWTTEDLEPLRLAAE